MHVCCVYALIQHEGYRIVNKVTIVLYLPQNEHPLVTFHARVQFTCCTPDHEQFS